MRRQFRLLVTIAVLAFAGRLTLGAQWLHEPYPNAPRTKNGAINMTGPVPRLNGKPDLSGIWNAPTGYLRNLAQDLKEEVPFQPWAKAKRDAMTRVELELSSANVNCTPVGTPGMFTDNAYVHMIDTKPGLFIHLIENNNRWNVVHTD